MEDNEGKYVVHPDEEIEFVSNPPAGGEPVPWLDAVLGDAAARKQAFCSWTIRGADEDTEVAIAFKEGRFNLPPGQTAVQVYDGVDANALEVEPGEERHCASPHPGVGEPKNRGFCGLST